MFELLLQADRALSGGNLDQAERTYWQLTELDPKNAIAIAGLARVAFERGDVRLARLFATRALVLDPENVAATRLVETIDASGEAPQEPGPFPDDLPLIAAQRLEALSRKRFIRDVDSDEGATAELPQPAGADEVAPASAPIPEAPRPQAVPPAPPLQGRRRIGRELAAAAAEMEAPAPDPALRRKPSAWPQFHLTPSSERGRRRFEPEEMKASPLADDPFAAAESEAVIEAVDEMDEVDEPAPHGLEQSETEPEVDLDDPAARESVALRLAMLGEEIGLESGDAPPASSDRPDDLAALRMSLLAGDTDLEAAEREEIVPEATQPVTAETDVETESEPDDLIAFRMAMLAGDAELEAAESAAQVESGVAAEVEVESGAEIAAEAGVAVEPELAAEVEATPESEPESEPEPTADASDWELSEREAEAEALREAVALLLDGETGGAGPEGTAIGSAAYSSPTEPQTGTAPAEPAVPAAPTEPTEPAAPAEPAAPSQPTEPAWLDVESVGSAQPAEPAEPAGQEPTPQHHRRGFFRRIIGG